MCKRFVNEVDNVYKMRKMYVNGVWKICKRCVKASCETHMPEMERVFTNVGKPQFKGSGFYETDYKKKGGG